VYQEINVIKKILLVIVVISLGLSLYACKKNDCAVIKVGKKNITKTALNKKLASLSPENQKYINTPVGRKQFVDIILKETIIIEAAKKAGIKKKTEYNKSIDDFRIEQKKQFDEYKDVLLREIYLKEIFEKIKPTNRDIEVYYNRNRSLFENPMAYIIKYIFTFDLRTAQDIYKSLKNGESFDKVTKKILQEDKFIGNSGLIGPFKKYEIIPEFQKVILNLKNNEMSEIIETLYGYYIIFKISEQELHPIPFDEAKENIKTIIEEEKFNIWLTNEKQKLKVKVNYTF
jgi:parvulin-like peptidyl-prolyl isomerase